MGRFRILPDHLPSYDDGIVDTSSPGVPLPDEFQLAADRARALVGEKDWAGLPFSEQAKRLYQEIRAMDEEKAATRPRLIP